MDPEEAIAEMDAALEIGGEDVVLRRIFGMAPNTANVDVTVRARTDAVSTQEIAAGIRETDLWAHFSPTQIDAAQWPGGQMPGLMPPFDFDPRIPIIGKDFLIVENRIRIIALVDTMVINGVIVRFNVRVTG